ncbi:hypothetical protein EDD18DRAFT_1358729 [Armillaria luteobubalina]|uniref:Uncharacterized protein n=1 Tax=Armillaria luteobubalina TaxID=153913 RepID=A0AA39URT5_9AGAR|nr:hypothetical protein EDD18DRAFT_1358729 [Armillaria luteobubalina]
MLCRGWALNAQKGMFGNGAVFSMAVGSSPHRVFPEPYCLRVSLTILQPVPSAMSPSRLGLARIVHSLCILKLGARGWSGSGDSTLKTSIQSRPASMPHFFISTPSSVLFFAPTGMLHSLGIQNSQKRLDGMSRFALTQRIVFRRYALWRSLGEDILRVEAVALT